MPDRHASSPACAEPDKLLRTPEAGRPVCVLLPLPLPAALDYLPPPGAAPAPGSFVRVPLGPRRLVGVVWEGADGSLPADRLKPILDVLPAPPLRPELRRFIERVAAYTMAPPGMVLRMAMSIAEALQPPRPRRLCTISPAGRAALAGSAIERVPTPPQRRVLAALCDAPLAAAEAARRSGCGAGVVRNLIARGLVEEFLDTADPPGAATAPQWQASGPALSADQQAAAQRLVTLMQAGRFSATLLDGVTGSGKTETYFAAIAAVLERGRQVLVLLPEIALGAQWLMRFRDRFGALPAQWHSDIGQTERRDTWRAVAAGRVPVVVGARSALFLPFPELGLIVVDEEHDPSFKQEDGVVYQARDMAVLRAALAGIPIVLASATPSLRNDRQRRPRPLRAGGFAASVRGRGIARGGDRRSAARTAARGRFLAPPLVDALAETFAAEEQALLLQNRRGYAPLTLCRACGHRLECPNCTAWLVEHRYTGQLLCAPLRPRRAGSPALPGVPDRRHAGALRSRRRTPRRGGRRASPVARTALTVSDLLTGPRAAAELAEAMAARRYDLDRDECREGASPSDADPGRRRRRRPGAGRRRTAGGGAATKPTRSGAGAAPFGLARGADRVRRCGSRAMVRRRNRPAPCCICGVNVLVVLVPLVVLLRSVIAAALVKAMRGVESARVLCERLVWSGSSAACSSSDRP